MTHDKLKAAIRERMAATGEPYCIARRAVNRNRRAATGNVVRYNATIAELASYHRTITDAIRTANQIATLKPAIMELPSYHRTITDAIRTANQIATFKPAIAELASYHRTITDVARTANQIATLNGAFRGTSSRWGYPTGR